MKYIVINNVDLDFLTWNLWYSFRGKQIEELFCIYVTPQFLKRMGLKVEETLNSSITVSISKEKEYTQNNYYHQESEIWKVGGRLLLYL